MAGFRVALFVTVILQAGLAAGPIAAQQGLSAEGVAWCRRSMTLLGNPWLNPEQAALLRQAILEAGCLAPPQRPPAPQAAAPAPAPPSPTSAQAAIARRAREEANKATCHFLPEYIAMAKGDPAMLRTARQAAIDSGCPSLGPVDVK